MHVKVNYNGFRVQYNLHLNKNTCTVRSPEENPAHFIYCSFYKITFYFLLFSAKVCFFDMELLYNSVSLHVLVNKSDCRCDGRGVFNRSRNKNRNRDVSICEKSANGTDSCWNSSEANRSVWAQKHWSSISNAVHYRWRHATHDPTGCS